MINVDWATGSLEGAPWVEGAYFEVVSDKSDAGNSCEIREQIIALCWGWA